jgi:FtsZ-binding cell division protein ZapB
MAEAEKLKVEQENPISDKEVDLDTTGFKEESVEVKEEAPKEEPKLNVGEVDLGYTDHQSKESEKAKVVVEEEKVDEQKEKTETKDTKKSTEEDKEQKRQDNLKKKRENYQSRIDSLVGRYRESQRRERAALDYAKGLQKKFEASEKKFNDSDEAYLKELDARVDAQREQVKNALKVAIQNQDSDKIMEANDKLTQLAVQKEKARLELANRAEQKKIQEEENKQKQNVEANQSTADNTPQPSQISDKAKAWAEKNEWFGKDEIMTAAAEKIHKNVIMEGIAVDSDEYYNEIDSRLKGYFPNALNQEQNDKPKEQRKPVQTVASAGRKQEGRRTVKLTASQVAIAKKLNVPLDEYAKYVKEDK